MQPPPVAPPASLPLDPQTPFQVPQVPLRLKPWSEKETASTRLATPPRGPTSTEVIGIEGACNRVAACAISPALQTLVFLFGRV